MLYLHINTETTVFVCVCLVCTTVGFLSKSHKWNGFLRQLAGITKEKK